MDSLAFVVVPERSRTKPGRGQELRKQLAVVAEAAVVVAVAVEPSVREFEACVV